jgi:5-methylcytosine-specific restriction endonuclease McrA
MSTRPKGRPKADYMKRADKLFSKYVRARDGACLNCGSIEFLQAAHIISRSYKSIRVNPDNCVCLCRSCHVMFTHKPLEWEAWVEARFPGRWDRLRRQALKYERVDWKAELESLRGLVG